MDVFVREQQVYEASVAALLRTEDGGTVAVNEYGHLVEEYGKLLKQFKQYRYMTSKAEQAVQVREANDEEILSGTHFDVLTGIFNKRYLHENLERTLMNMGRAGDMLSIILMDVDCFKVYNDIYGPDSSDDALRSIAEALKECIFRGQDFVARYGGDEFVAVLPHTPEQGARLVADRMLEGVRRLNIPNSGSTVPGGIVTVSIGLVTGTRNPSRWLPQDFYARMEEAVALAKDHGRNQYAYLGLSG
jgi:diguanylate cyclase (GGDEF)-like protein